MALACLSWDGKGVSRRSILRGSAIQRSWEGKPTWPRNFSGISIGGREPEINNHLVLCQTQSTKAKRPLRYIPRLGTVPKGLPV